MRKILVITNILSNGGIETNILNLLKQFKEHFNFSIATKQYHENTHLYQYLIRNKINLLRCSFPSTSSISRFKLLYSAFVWPVLSGFKRFDEILSYETRFSIVVPLYKFLLLKKDGKFIWCPVGHPGMVRKIALEHFRFWKYVDMIVVESEVHKNKLKDLFSEHKLLVIYSFCFQEFKKIPKCRSYTKCSEIHMAYFGRYSENKGLLELLQIFKEISFSEPNIKLSFFGNHGDYREKLKTMIEAWNLTEKVSLNDGWNNEDEYQEILDCVDFVVLPSKSEGLPLVLLECMAYGKPFVATDVGAISLLAVDNPDVIVVNNRYDDIKSGILKMIDKIRNNEIDSNRLRNYYNKKFGKDLIISKWKALLDS